MYPKNAASPPQIAIGAVVQISDGAVQASGVSVTYKIDGGTETGSGGTVAYSTGGVVLYTPAQAETNGSVIIITAYKTGCIPANVTVVTTDSATAGRVNVASIAGTAAALGGSSGNIPIVGTGTNNFKSDSAANVTPTVTPLTAQQTRDAMRLSSSATFIKGALPETDAATGLVMTGYGPAAATMTYNNTAPPTVQNIVDGISTTVPSGKTNAFGARIPDAVGGAANGLFIAGVNAATSVTTAFTATFTGNLTGNVGGTVPNSAGVTSILADYARRTGDYSTLAAGAAMTLTSVYDAAKSAAGVGAKMDIVDAPNATAVTAIQNGLSKPGTAQTITAPADMALQSTLTNVTYGLSALHTEVAKDVTVSKPGTAQTITLPAAPTDWIDAASVKADAVTKIQSGFSGVALGTNAPSGWINAAAIASSALNDKGNWRKAITIDGKSEQEALQIMAAVIAGKNGTTATDFIGLDGLTTRVTGTIVDGKRTVVSYP